MTFIIPFSLVMYVISERQLSLHRFSKTHFIPNYSNQLQANFKPASSFKDSGESSRHTTSGPPPHQQPRQEFSVWIPLRGHYRDSPSQGHKQSTDAFR